MSLLTALFVAASCLLLPDELGRCFIDHQEPAQTAASAGLTARPQVAAAAVILPPQFTGESTDVLLTAEAVYAWDLQSGATLYQKNSRTPRPIASLTKLATTLLVADAAPLSQSVEITDEAVAMRRRGVHVSLPLHHHASVDELLGAALIASANDAAVALAVAVSGSEAAFIERLNEYLKARNIHQTKLANATGLADGEQYSTAEDVKELLTQAYFHPVLGRYLALPAGTLTTTEGATRKFESTNQLLKSYVPIVAAKTGYTPEAGENLAIITEGPAGQKVGAVILGSDARFQDMKVLVEWLWRNYSWN